MAGGGSMDDKPVEPQGMGMETNRTVRKEAHYSSGWDGFISGVTLEERITAPKTGGQKGRKLERHSLIPSYAMSEVAAVYGRGATKYAARNWELGYAWSLSLDALLRHLSAFMR